MFSQSVSDTFERLGEELGIEQFEFDDDGYCLLRVDDAIDLAIELDEDSQSIILSADCGDLPSANREKVLQELLDANFYWAGSGGATFATNSQTDTVCLQAREAAAQLDLDRLRDLLLAMISNAEAWRQRLEDISAGRTPTETNTELPPDAMHV